MSLGGGLLYDQLREIPRGADQNVLVGWSDIMREAPRRAYCSTPSETTSQPVLT